MKCVKCGIETNVYYTRDVDEKGEATKNAKYWCIDCVMKNWKDVGAEAKRAYAALKKKQEDLKNGG